MKVLFRRDIMVFTHPLWLIVFLGLILEMIMTTFNVDTEKNSPMDFMFFGAMQAMIISVFPQSIMGEDERIGWQKFCLTVPIRRSSYVSEKFIFTLCFLVLSGLLSSGGVISLMVQTTGFDFKEYILVLSVIVGVPMLMMSLNLPMMFRFGTKKGLLFFVSAFLLLFVGGLALFLWASYSEGGRSFFREMQQWDNLIMALCILLVAAVIYVTAWLLSVRFYNKREF